MSLGEGRDLAAAAAIAGRHVMPDDQDEAQPEQVVDDELEDLSGGFKEPPGFDKFDIADPGS